jgi:Uma2 family endonuclease
MSAQPIANDRLYTTSEYFEILRDSLHKIEFVDGRLRMMAGGTEAHTDIVDNTFVALRNAESGCKVRSSETAVTIQNLNRYYFPDMTAVCEEKTSSEPGKGIFRITNPALIVEVLSESTAGYDRGEKFSAYRQLDSFREYLLIDSRKMYVETFYREEHDLWRIGNYYEADQEVPLRTLGISLPPHRIYEGVEFSEQTPQ